MADVTPSAVVPAAGRSSRFGGPKLLADVQGRPLIRRTLEALAAGGIDDVVVVIGPEAPRELVGLLDDSRVTTVVNPEPDRGMFSSIHAGLIAAAGSPVLVLPADMPFVQPATVRAVVDACRATGRVVVPAVGPKRGHPVALPRVVCDAIAAKGDPRGTLKDAFQAAAGGPPVELPVEDAGVLHDVDVPGDLV
ncbi:MAG: nucleotidyltransferase family protein [Acidobacteria bacterium]|nr:nucleotidyltransferase family protein [Acidobacteriota bacterium]